MGLINPGGSPSNTFPSGVYTDNIYERTVGAGVDVNGMKVKGGIPNIAAVTPVPTADGDLVYDSATGQYKGRISGNTIIMATGVAPGVKGAVGGKPPTYNNAASIILPAGLMAWNSTNAVIIEVSSNITLSLATGGAGGLDTGSEAANTWYFVYLIRKSSNGQVSAVFSAVNESVSGTIAYPSGGYDQKRQLPIAVRNDNSSNIRPFYINDWGLNPLILYREPINVVPSGGSTSYTTQSAAASIPPISRMGLFRLTVQHTTASTAGAIDVAHVTATGSGATDGMLQASLRATSGGAFNLGQNQGPCATNSSQQIDYKRTQSGGGAPSVSVDTVGYYVTELF